MKDQASKDDAPPPDLLARVERGVITAIFSGLIVIGAMQIVSRYAIRMPISRTEMLLPNIFTVLVFLTLAATFRLRENIAVSFLPDGLTGRARQVYLTGLWAVAIGFLGYLAVSAADVLVFQMRIGAVTNVGLPAALITGAVPLGCGLSIYRIVQTELLPVWRGR